MATSGAMNTSNTYVKYKITVTQNSQNEANNTSNVTVSVRFYRTNTGYSTYGTGKVYCRIDGKLYSADVTPSNKITNSGIVLFTKTLNVAHADDGTKKLSTSAWISLNTPLTSNEQAYTQTLTTIAQISKPSCITWPNHTVNVGEFGDIISVHMNRQSANFTHRVSYHFYGANSASLVETVCIDADTGKAATAVETGFKWKIPLDVMNYFPNSTSVRGYIIARTYSGTTFVGESECEINVKVPASVKPKCYIQVLDDTDTKDTYGNLVRGLSKLRVNVGITELGYGSPIKAQSSTIKNFTADGSQGLTETYSGYSFVTDPLAYGGNVTVSTTVTDNRGRKSDAATATFPVLDYEKPRVTAIAVHRTSANGTEDENGDYVKVTFSAAISPLNNKNSAEYTLRYINNSTGAETTKKLTDITGRYAVSDYSVVFPADSGSSYTVEITAKDDIESIPVNTSVSTAFTLYNCHKSGTGWAFGKVAEEENTLENALEMRQIGNSFAFQPSAFNGDKGYTLLAVITLKTLNVNAPIVFVINRRGALCPMTVYVRFASSSTTTDPDLGSITYEGDNYGAFLVRAATSTWKLYVDNTSGWSNPCLQEWYTTDNQNARLSVTFPSEQVDTLPDPWYRATPAKMQSLLDYIYPVGSIYLSYSHVNPATLFGGTWARLENAFLWAVDSSGVIGQTGGEKTHTLTVNEIPSHSHGSVYSQHASGTKDKAWYNTAGSSVAYGAVATGGGAAHNNMPPYIQVSAWRRTA